MTMPTPLPDPVGASSNTCSILPTMRKPLRKKPLRTRPSTMPFFARRPALRISPRSEEHTSDLQSLMRISYAVFCLKKKNNKHVDCTHRQEWPPDYRRIDSRV